MEVKCATWRTFAVNLRNIIAVLAFLAITSWLKRSEVKRKLVRRAKHLKSKIVRTFFLKIRLVILSEDPLATFKTTAKNSGPAIGASLVTSVIRLSSNSTASAYTFNRIIFLATMTSWSELCVESVTVGVCVV